MLIAQFTNLNNVLQLIMRNKTNKSIFVTI